MVVLVPTWFVEEQMHRRDFIALSVGTVAFWPFLARAQGRKMPIIGILLTGNPDPEVFLKGFRDALRDSGYIDGQNCRLVVRSAEGNSSLLPNKAAELVSLNVDVIV